MFIIVILFPYILLGTLASKAVQGSRFKIVCISVVAFAVNLVVWPYALSWRGVPIYVALMAAITAGLIYWCGIARRRALKIVGWYLAANSTPLLIRSAKQEHRSRLKPDIVRRFSTILEHPANA